MEALKQMFCLHFVQRTIKTSYSVYAESKTFRLHQLDSVSCHQRLPHPASSVPFVTAEFQNKALWTDPGWRSYSMSRTSALACLSVPLTTTVWVPPHASLPSGGPQCGDWSATSPLIPISTCGVIETRVSSCQGLGHHVIEFYLVSQSATKHSTG